MRFDYKRIPVGNLLNSAIRHVFDQSRSISSDVVLEEIRCLRNINNSPNSSPLLNRFESSCLTWLQLMVNGFAHATLLKIYEKSVVERNSE